MGDMGDMGGFLVLPLGVRSAASALRCGCEAGCGGRRPIGIDVPAVAAAAALYGDCGPGTAAGTVDMAHGRVETAVTRSCWYLLRTDSAARGEWWWWWWW